MNQNRTAGEPSMEEILSSIRRIIAEEDTGAAPSAPGAGPSPASAAAPPASARMPEARAQERSAADDDVLELTEVVPAEEPQAAPVTDLRAAAPAVDAVDPQAAPAPREELKPVTAADHLVSNDAANSSVAAMARLARAAQPEERAQPANPNAGSVTVDALVTELLRPILKDWLEKNLPAMVERVVEQEVKKLARRAEML